ncbi:MAG TPA: TIGR03087 family PEP-CTERM/XrtA system glycosyltransferase [Candidatus Cybelea sp.]|nr:TIGR03087 family PEP-CTERM/XrtA system glycosyltransferase [Candidatus Cybelea sp.]
MQDLLFLAHRLPYPPVKGDKIRSWNILRHLAQRYRVHVGCFVDDRHDWQYVDEVARIAASHCILPLSPRWSRVKSLGGLIRGEPLSVAYFRQAGLQHWVDDVMARHRPKRAFIYCSAMAPYVMTPVTRSMRRIVDMVDVDSDKWRQYASRHSWPVSAIYAREAATLLAFERRVAADCAATLFVSPHEAELFRGLAPESASRVRHVNNGVDADFFDPSGRFDNPYSPDELPVVFTGAMDYWPNVDAVMWFASEVMPRTASRGLPIRFHVVGSNPTAEVRALGRNPRIAVTGRVPDVRPYLLHAAAVVAPLRITRGVQNKVLEGMAMARPVLATSAALEGIEAEPGRHVVLADRPEDFAEKLLLLLQDRQAEEFGRRARAHVLATYGWQQNLARLDEVLDDDGLSGPGEPHAVDVGHVAA